MTKELVCPACGSSDLKLVAEQKSHQLTLGKDFQYLEHVYICNLCGEKGDFENKNDPSFELAESNALKQLVPSLIDDLSKEHISMARFERAFELPQRTLTRWKSGDFSATSVALLRTVKTFPLIVDVAEKKFDKGYATKSICIEAMRSMSGFVESQQGTVDVVLSTNGTSVSLQTKANIPLSGKSVPILKAMGS